MLNTEDREDLAEEIRESLQGQDVDLSTTSRIAPELFQFIIGDRNKYAIAEATKIEGDVSLVWGKAHAEGMIKLLQDQGFKLKSSEKI